MRLLLPSLSRICQALSLALLLVLAPLAKAQTPATTAPGVSSGNILQAFIGLAIIIGLLLLAAFFMRRLYGGRAFGLGPMKLLGGIPVGNRERILLVEIQDTWLVIGLAPGQIRTLHTLPKGELPQDTTTPPFAHWLNQVLARHRETPQ